MKHIAAGLLLLALILPLSAENTVQSELTVANLITMNEGADPTYLMVGGVDLSFSSAGYGNMKGTLSLGFSDSSTPNVPSDPLKDSFIRQLELKGRFPEFRITTGLTRLDWGEGTLLNSANVLFSDDVGTATLSRSSVQLGQKWLLALQKPLTPFSFMEAAVVAPDDALLEHTTGGVRYYNGEQAVAWEGGLSLTRLGADSALSPHIALSGGSLFEWYGSVSTSLPLTEDAMQGAKENISASAGLFHMFLFGYQQSITLTGEVTYAPYGDSPLLFYPSLVFAPATGTQLSVQAIISAEDGSADLSAGGSWNPFEGFTLFTFLSSRIGDTGDTYEYKGVTATVGFSSLF